MLIVHGPVTQAQAHKLEKLPREIASKFKTHIELADPFFLPYCYSRLRRKTK